MEGLGLPSELLPFGMRVACGFVPSQVPPTPSLSALSELSLILHLVFFLCLAPFLCLSLPSGDSSRWLLTMALCLCPLMRMVGGGLSCPRPRAWGGVRGRGLHPGVPSTKGLSRN